MYKCKICNQVIPPHTKAIRIPIETRPRQYPSRQKEVSAGHGKTRTITVQGGVGYEIVRELVACPSCAAQHNKGNQTEAATA